MKAGAKVTEDLLAEYTPGQWKSIALRNDERMADVEALKKQMDDSIGALQARFESKVEKLQRGDELPPGVMKMVKVFFAVNRKLQPAAKIAERHANQGDISKI